MCLFFFCSHFILMQSKNYTQWIVVNPSSKTLITMFHCMWKSTLSGLWFEVCARAFSHSFLYESASLAFVYLTSNAELFFVSVCVRVCLRFVFDVDAVCRTHDRSFCLMVLSLAWLVECAYMRDNTKNENRKIKLHTDEKACVWNGWIVHTKKPVSLHVLDSRHRK